MGARLRAAIRVRQRKRRHHFLMGIEQPTTQVIAAVDAGVRWLQASTIAGIRVERFTNGDGQSDRRVVSDPAAEPMWALLRARLQPPDRSGPRLVVHYTYAEIEYERRNGYSYYATWARTLLEREYPAWRDTQTPRRLAGGTMPFRRR
jgi:PelA/Pel-15E family pectate lyase